MAQCTTMEEWVWDMGTQPASGLRESTRHILAHDTFRTFMFRLVLFSTSLASIVIPGSSSSSSATTLFSTIVSLAGLLSLCFFLST
ncbi:hypothetical protein NL676_038087 [Syzygium grande]|nr:hypothetical protein NL676_038087 [Syzygium grande]